MPKVAKFTVPDEDWLVDSIYAEIAKDDELLNIDDISNLVLRLGNGKVMHWGTGGKVQQSDLWRAHAAAKSRLEAEQDAEQDERARAEFAVSSSGSNAIHLVGPDFDPLATNPASCSVSGAGIQSASVGHTAEFFIEARNGTGAMRREGGDSFFVAIRGCSRVRARIADKGDGTYSCTWTPPQSGTYNIVVSCFGNSVPGSPFVCHALTPQPYAPQCAVSGAALLEAVARTTQTFDISFRDKLGYTTQAVDLDVFVEAVPIESPQALAGTAGAPPLDRRFNDSNQPQPRPQPQP